MSVCVFKPKWNTNILSIYTLTLFDFFKKEHFDIISVSEQVCTRLCPKPLGPSKDINTLWNL